MGSQNFIGASVGHVPVSPTLCAGPIQGGFRLFIAGSRHARTLQLASKQQNSKSWQFRMQFFSFALFKQPELESLQSLQWFTGKHRQKRATTQRYFRQRQVRRIGYWSSRLLRTLFRCDILEGVVWTYRPSLCRALRWIWGRIPRRVGHGIVLGHGRGERAGRELSPAAAHGTRERKWSKLCCLIWHPPLPLPSYPFFPPRQPLYHGWIQSPPYAEVVRQKVSSKWCKAATHSWHCCRLQAKISKMSNAELW